MQLNTFSSNITFAKQYYHLFKTPITPRSKVTKGPPKLPKPPKAPKPPKIPETKGPHKDRK